jgi:hypothetical protein
MTDRLSVVVAVRAGGGPAEVGRMSRDTAEPSDQPTADR